MKKSKILAVLLSVTLVFTSSSICFAANGIDGEQIQAEATAELVEDITGTEDINQNIEETADGFEVEGEDVDITLPEDGDGNIVMDSEEESIGMGLPEEVQDEEGILTDDGTVIYGATEDVSVAVQVVEEEQNGATFEFARALVTIDNADAPKEYSFKFDLPEGYKLVTDKEYCEKYATEEEKEWYNSLEDGFVDELYVLDADNQIVQTIDPAWAKDANGNEVDTYYEIKGDELVQVVNFDEDTVFPVVADPTSHPAKYTTKKTLTKEQAKNLYIAAMEATSSELSDFATVVGFLALVASAFASGGLAVGCAFVGSTCTVAGAVGYISVGKFKEEARKLILYKKMTKKQHLKIYDMYTWRYYGKNKGGKYKYYTTICKIV